VPQEIDTAGQMADLNPEAIFAIPDTAAAQILSDDGGVRIDGEACKDLDDDSEKSFRSIVFVPG